VAGRELLAGDLLPGERLHRSRDFLTDDVLFMVGLRALDAFFILLQKRTSILSLSVVRIGFILLLELLFSLGVRVAQDDNELLTNLADPLSKFIFLLDVLQAELLFDGLDFPLVFLLLGDKEEVLIELCELLEYCPFPRIFTVVLRYLNDGVDHLHNEASIIPIILILNLDIVAEEEIVLLVVDTVDFVDYVAHSKSASRGRSHGIHVS
jgi:hypothetical protein